jgi:glutathione peroxidase
MRYFIALLALIIMTGGDMKNVGAAAESAMYDFSFKTLIQHDPMPLSAYRGKVVMVVNTASACGFTPQYEGLQKIYEAYKDKGFVVIAVPSNDFGQQESGDEKTIASFCKLNYGVTFPVAAKEVVTGDNAHPFYKWAREQLGMGTSPKWNFHKYLIGRDGKIVDYFVSTTAPDSDKVKKAIEKLL